MIELLVFVAVILLVIGGPLTAVLLRSRPKPGRTRLVLAGVAGGEAEAGLWCEALRDAGVWFQVRNIGDVLTGDLTTPGGSGPHAYQYELWVRPEDEARAREVLAL